MLRNSLFLACAALLLGLATSSRAHAWGACHAAYGPGGYSAGYTHVNPYNGNVEHVGTTGGYGAPGGYNANGYHYNEGGPVGGAYGGAAGVHYGGYAYGGYGGVSAGYVAHY